MLSFEWQRAKSKAPFERPPTAQEPAMSFSWHCWDCAYTVDAATGVCEKTRQHGGGQLGICRRDKQHIAPDVMHTIFVGAIVAMSRSPKAGLDQHSIFRCLAYVPATGLVHVECLRYNAATYEGCGKGWHSYWPAVQQGGQALLPLSMCIEMQGSLLFLHHPQPEKIWALFRITQPLFPQERKSQKPLIICPVEERNALAALLPNHQPTFTNFFAATDLVNEDPVAAFRQAGKSTCPPPLAYNPFVLSCCIG